MEGFLFYICNYVIIYVIIILYLKFNIKNMFITFKNYLKIFNLFLYNAFAWWLETSWTSEEKPIFKWDSLKDLKTLKNYLKDWKIDTEEAGIINKEYENIKNEAKDWLNEITNEMFQKWFSAKDKKSYNSFKKLIEKTNGQKLPEWDSIIRAVSNNISPLNDMFKWWTKPDKSSNFHWIEIKQGEILVRYDWIWPSDTYSIDFNMVKNSQTNKTEFKINNKKWLNNKWELEDYKNKSVVDKTFLDKDINKLEKEEMEEAKKREEKAERQEREKDNKEYFKNQEIINWNKSEFTEDWIKLIQKKLWIKDDWDFWPNTLEAVKKIDKDWKIGLWVLKKLWLVDKNNNAINGLTKSMFKPWKLEQWNSRYIIFKEKNITQKENKQNQNLNSETNQEKKYKKFDMEKTPETKQILNILGKAELKEAFDWLKEWSWDTWKKTIWKIHWKEVIIFQVLNQKYLEIKTGDWYKDDPEMKIDSYKDINQKNIEDLYSKIK